MLRLYDHLTEVNFASVGLYVARGGWPIQVAPMLPDGELAEVTQSITFEWSETSAFKRNRVLSLLSELGKRAVLNQDPATANYHLPENWVVLESQTPGEGGYRYGIVTDIQVPTLDSLNHRPNTTISLTLNITHKGAWWGVSPHELPPVLFDHDSVGNVDDDTYDNYIPIDGSLIQGDWPALLIMDNVYISADIFGNGGDDRIAITPDSNINHLCAEDASGGVGSALITGDLGGSFRSCGGKYWQTTGGNDADHTWTLADPMAHAGTYQVYLVAGFNYASPDATMNLRHGWQGRTSTIGTVQASGGVSPSTWQSFYFGQITLPAGGTVPRSFKVGSTFPYIFNVTVESNANTFYMAGLYLIPSNYNILRIPLSTSFNSGWLMDGRTERVYQLNSSLEITLSDIEADGRFPTLLPHRDQRIYVYARTDDVPHFDYDLTRDMTVRVIPRYRYLRSD